MSEHCIAALLSLIRAVGDHLRVYLQKTYGRIYVSESCLKTFPAPKLVGFSMDSDLKAVETEASSAASDDIAAKIKETFKAILENSILEQRLF